MTHNEHHASGSGFRKFFLRGLAILLPSILTIWILFVAYQFVRDRIAQPINGGVRTAVLRFTDWPAVTQDQIDAHREELSAKDRAMYGDDPVWLEAHTRSAALNDLWSQYAIPLDLIGLILAIVVIYLAGAILGSFVGRRLYLGGERLIGRMPLVRHVYPSVKQVTDFLVGTDEMAQRNRMKFNRVVAVEYPRKGLWSIGLVTGNTLRNIQDSAGQACLTVFVPSSPTPFTGYVITVPQNDTIDLPVTIEQALRFTVSGGVIVPPSQLIEQADADEASGDVEASSPPAARAG